MRLESKKKIEVQGKTTGRAKYHMQIARPAVADVVEVDARVSKVTWPARLILEMREEIG